MCHLVVALNAHPDFPFVVCSNRDEFSDRPFSAPALHGDGALYGEDDRSRVTCLGVHVVRGHFAALTNIGGRGGPGGVSRGQLTAAFVSDPARGRALLEGRAQYRGFNLAWCEDVRADRPILQLASNCDPDDRGGPGRPRILTRRSDGAGLVFGLGNDLPGDEHVKSPFVESAIRRILAGVGRAPGSGPVDRELVSALRDQLVEPFCSRTASVYPWAAVGEKFVSYSARRRLQPGARSALAAGSALSVGAALLGASPAGVCAAGLAGVGLGLWHHLRMQHLFVDVPAGSRRWTTVAQTVIVVDRAGTLHFFQRETLAGPQRAGPWHTTVAPRD